MKTQTILFTSIAGLLMACAGGEVSEAPMMTSLAAPSGPVTPVERFFLVTVDGPNALTVAPSGRFVVDVTYFESLEIGLEAMPEAELNVWLEGSYGDSRLGASTVHTDAEGRARIEGFGSTTPSAFQVGINGYKANTVFIDVKVEAPAVPEVEEPLPPVLEGNYDVQSIYNLTEALGDGANSLRRLGEGFSDPGAFLAGYIRPSGLVGDLIQAVAGSIITGMIRERAPDWLEGMMRIGDDIAGMLTTMKVRSQLNVVKGQSAGVWSGTHTWKTVTYTWEDGCPRGDDACGEHELNIEGDVFESVSGSINEHGELTINEHAMKVDVGGLAASLVGHVFLRARTGHDSFGSMLAELVDCDEFGRRGQASVEIPFTAGLIGSACRSAMDEAGESLADQVVDALDMELGMQLGAGTAQDKNTDGDYDHWTGEWTGVPGRFLAERINP